MTLLSQTRSIVRIEAHYFARHPKLLLAALVAMLIPALYALIYLVSVWDPAGKTGQLPVGIVNLDEGMIYRDQAFNLGRDVVGRLKAGRRFGFQDLNDADQARQLVRQGALSFALIIPPEFSATAIPGVAAGHSKPLIYTSEGNNFESAGIARRFAEALGEELNDSLNERRWAMVLESAVGSQKSVDDLRAATRRLHQGALELSSGALKAASGARTLEGGSGQLKEGVTQLTSGVQKLGNGLRQMDARRPSHNELNQLRQGAERLAAGHGELESGLIDLRSGTQQLQSGIKSFQDETSDNAWVPAALTDGLNKMGHGVNQLDSGLSTAQTAQSSLASGARELSTGVGKLTGGARALSGGIHTMVVELPLNSQLSQLDSGASVLASSATRLADGTQSVAKGSQMLSQGIEQLARAMPTTIARPEGSAQGLAHSVQPVVEVEAPVRNTGHSFAPNVIPAALWLGAGIIAFLLHVRVLPMQARGYSPVAQLLGKIALPALLVLLQAAILLACVGYLLKIPVAHPGAVVLIMALTALNFLLITFALSRAFGDAGKALAMVLLAIQLSSSGGILPVELSGKLFVDISPWLPMTWIIKALKAGMFNAYEGQWLQPLLLGSISLAVAALMACVVGQWRFANSDTIRPPVDL